MNARRFHDAISCLDFCLQYEPNSPHAHWNKAVCLLSIGDYKNGFRELEWRWKLFDACWGLLDKDVKRVEGVRRWQGEDISDKHLLLYHEQGYGDAIMMLRFLPQLLVRAGKLTLLTVKPLQRLIEKQFGIDMVATLPADLSAFDVRAALFDPVSLLPTGIPAQPYINVKLEPEPDTLGICWSGNTQRTFSYDDFVSLLDTGGRKLYALQPGSPATDCVKLDGDFLDTAQRMARMETIVTVDTSAANLAGAIGHPNAHIVLPYLKDWRWYRAERWYPTLKLYQQPKPNDWFTPFNQINAEMKSRDANQPSDRRLSRRLEIGAG